MIDLTQSHIWDGSAAAAIGKVVRRFQQCGVPVEVVGLNETSTILFKRLTILKKSVCGGDGTGALTLR